MYIIKYNFIYSGNADEVKEKIENGLIDIGLLLEPVDLSKFEYVRLPVKEHLGVMVKSDSPLAEKEYLTPQDLAGIPIVASRRTLVQNEWLSWLGDYANELNMIGTYNLMYNAVIQMREGFGSVLGIELDANYEGVTFMPLMPPIELGTVLVWKKNKMFSSAISAFIRHCKKCI